MSSMAVLLNTFPFNLPKLKPVVLHRKPLKRTRRFDGCRRVFQGGKTSLLVFQFLKPPSFRIRSHQQGDVENNEATDHKDNEDEKVVVSEILNDSKSVHHNTDGSFLPKLGIALGLAFTITIFCIGFKGPGLRTPVGGLSLADSSSSSAIASSVGFTFKVFGYKFVLPEYAPGWVYFWLLMAAGCGLFISEEALNIWVGISLARLLTLDGTWHSFAGSLSKNAPYIISTIHWVYWGVCISDMVPFYLGKLFRQSGASEDVCSKLGIGKDKALSITKAVQRYGNLIGAVERFSIGVRNPTAFLAGALGISPECFFAGVCCGGLITLPVQVVSILNIVSWNISIDHQYLGMIFVFFSLSMKMFQLGIGFVLRERPVFALATVATVVGIWTVFPYAMAASTAVFLFFRRRSSF